MDGMGYRELPSPAPGLACAWVRVGEQGGTARIVPDACADLVWRAGGGTHLAGPDTTAACSPVAAGEVIVGVRFAPGAAGPALGVDLSGWRDARVPLAELPGPGEDPRAALRALVAHARALTARAPADAAVAEAARRLRAEPRLHVGVLARELGLSERQLRRRCLAAAGHAPKVLQRVLRFQAFLAAADADPDAELAWLAAAQGYADQAHLTNEVTALAGVAPAALLRSRRSTPAAGAATAAGTT